MIRDEFQHYSTKDKTVETSIGVSQIANINIVKTKPAGVVRKLLIPYINADDKIKVEEDGITNNTYQDGTIVLKTPRSKLKVTVTGSQGDVRVWKRDFSTSKTIIADDINLR